MNLVLPVSVIWGGGEKEEEYDKNYLYKVFIISNHTNLHDIKS